MTGMDRIGQDQQDLAEILRNLAKGHKNAVSPRPRMTLPPTLKTSSRHITVHVLEPLQAPASQN